VTSSSASSTMRPLLPANAGLPSCQQLGGDLCSDPLLPGRLCRSRRSSDVRRAATRARPPVAPPGAAAYRSITAAGRSGAENASRPAARWVATTAVRAALAPPVTNRWAVHPIAARAARRVHRVARWEEITAARPHRVRVAQRSSGSRGTVPRAARLACQPAARREAVDGRPTIAEHPSGAGVVWSPAGRWEVTTVARAALAPPVTNRWAVRPTVTRVASRALRVALSGATTVVRPVGVRRITLISGGLGTATTAAYRSSVV
jgi:hypothetical protein